MSSQPPFHPSLTEEALPGDVTIIQEDDGDRPRTASLVGNDVLSGVVLGCAVFGAGIYNDDRSIFSDLPVRLVRLALRYGITAFDTSPHYHPSELILSRALTLLAPEFPRESYAIITKAGKFGPKAAHHDYSVKAITASVERSLARFNPAHGEVEPYLDVVYLHDVEFIADKPDPAGLHLDALSLEQSANYNLASLHDPAAAPRSLGAGDDLILGAIGVLRQFQVAGKIQQIGIAGYGLPLLLRLSLLIQSSTGIPLDIIQSYGHHNLLTSTLPTFLPYFENAGVKQVANASPFNMGILTTRGPPAWHPASEEVKRGAREVVASLDGDVKIEELAAGFGMRDLKMRDGRIVPVVVGAKNLEELHLSMDTYNRVHRPSSPTINEKSKAQEQSVREMFRAKGIADSSWQSPPDES